MTNQNQAIQRTLRDAADDSHTVSFRRGYSGRGMYGFTCVGIVGDYRDCFGVICEAIKRLAASGLPNPEIDEVVGTLTDFKQDQMGKRDVILYWPELPPIQEDFDA